jgi:uncharacterized protein YecT (DUF1311 family)
MPRSSATTLLHLLALGLAFIFAPAARAEDINCANASSTVEMNFCADKDFEAADKALNATYEATLATTKTRDLEEPYDAKSFEEAMRAAQRAWVAYRDADCKGLVAQEWAGGSGTSAAVLGCMTEKTIERTKELKERYGEH